MDARGRQSEIKKQDERERGQEKDWQMVLAEAFDTEAFLTTVGAGRTIATYKPKSYIFRQGTKSAAVFYIQKGRVELSVVSSQGKERVVGMLEPGAFVGEGCLAGHPLYLASARASTEATLVRVETATMIEVIHDHTELSERFMAFLLLRNSQIEADLVDQLFNSSEKRLALTHHAGPGRSGSGAAHGRRAHQPGSDGRARRNHALTHQLLHEQVPQARVIEYNGHLKVHSSLLNVIVRE